MKSARFFTVFFAVCLTVSLLSAPPYSTGEAAAEPAATAGAVIAASGTSYGPGSTSALALLTPEGGLWKPKSKDSGSIEGVYFQFKDPIPVSGFEVDLKGGGGRPVAAYINGQLCYIDSFFNEDGITTGRTSTTLENEQAEEESGPVPVKSLFIRIEKNARDEPPVEIAAVRFFDADGTTLSLRLPIIVEAEVTATSTLAPETAYAPARLFDSQFDIAWATDGKKSNGINESATVSFKRQQTIQSIMVWNGYQRSDVHFKANGRVKSLDINGQTIPVKDLQTVQEIRLPQPITADKVTLTIKDTYKGGSYKDVLISELRFLTPSGDIILPQVAEQEAALPESLQFMQDVTYSSFIQDCRPEKAVEFESLDSYPMRCGNVNLRLRSNGSFVIYKAQDDEGLRALSNTNVLEGNWEPAEGGVRIFGKKYAVMLEESDNMYLRGGDVKGGSSGLPAPRIFQARMSVSRYNDLPEKERENVLRFLTDTLAGENKDGGFIIVTTVPLTAGDNEYFKAGSLDEARKNLDARLKELNPVYVKSDVLTQLLLPEDALNTCMPIAEEDL